MNSKNISKAAKLKQIKSETYFENLKSNYILKKKFSHFEQNKGLNIIKYNKQLQKRFDLNINDYKRCSCIVIELIPIEHEYDTFINIPKEEKEYYHIYFDNSKNEIKRNYLEENENVKRIDIIISFKAKSFKDLFADCKCISSIFFKNFNGKNLTNVSHMFNGCKSLKEINFCEFNDENVTDMSYMFFECSSLKQLNLSNFKTNKVTNMKSMFCGCSSLEELNLSNFNTKNVTDMSHMFFNCLALKNINVSNFETNNVTNISYMFSGCSSLKKLNLSNFNSDKVTNMSYMFYGCSSLKDLNINFNTDKVTNMSYMFYGCSSLNQLNLSTFIHRNTIDTRHMFF